MTMIQLLIVADDFTGGLDTGVQFAEKGISTRVVTNPDVDFDQAARGSQVLVVVAETRHLPAGEAYRMVYDVVKKGVRLHIPYIYKKTDSALRGNIGAELTAALDASGAKTLSFLPAMPGLNRVTRGGIHYIDGVPVAESVFGRDPFEPVRKSSVSELLALQSRVPARNAAPDAVGGGEGILIVDAETDDDLLRAGRSLREKGLLRVMAGCAGFAAMLPELLALSAEDRPVAPLSGEGLFVLCGSVNPITQRQLRYAEDCGFARIHIRPEQKMDERYFDTPAGEQALTAWREANERSPWLILDANDSRDDNAESAAYAARAGLTMEDVRQRISGALGHILPAILASRVNKVMLITGGDTLLQCMNYMGVWEMEPMYQVFPGIVLSRFEAGGVPRYVITKSGGFGQETLLCDLQDMIESEPVEQRA